MRVGGDRFDDAIINFIRRNYGMLIGEPTAEAIKKSIGSAFPGSEVKEMEVRGRNLSEGVPRSFTISSNEILEALTDPLNQIVSAVKTALEHTRPNSRRHRRPRHDADRRRRLLRDLDRLLAEETGLPVLVAEDPLTCVVRGCGMALERMDRLGSISPANKQSAPRSRPDKPALARRGLTHGAAFPLGQSASTMPLGTLDRTPPPFSSRGRRRCPSWSFSAHSRCSSWWPTRA